jgi:uncharacterized protein (TIGR03118 family)
VITVKDNVSGFLCCASLALLSACGGYGGGNAYPTPPPATVTIAVVPTTITQGQVATLTWSSNSGTSCTASGAWTGAQGPTGTQSVAITTVGNNAFTLTCTGAAYSSTSASAVLGVNAASAFTKSSLVTSDGSLANVAQDPLLIGPRGIALSGGSTIWAADHGSQNSTLYDGTGIPQALTVQIPAGARGNANLNGIVFNGTATDFVVTSGTKSAGAVFIFAGDSGTISGWSPTVDGTHAITMHDNIDGAVFKGLAIANDGTANHLYAADFHNNKVLVFDSTFTKVTVPGGFADTTLPVGYAPFGIQAVQLQGQTRIVVTYAKQDTVALNQTNGPGLGMINVFDTNGVLVKHLVAVGGALNAPWGVALAPDTFGTLSNKLLVANVGSGVINAYDPITGDVAGAISDASLTAIATPALWGIAFGNGAHNQPKSTLYFFAGLNAGAGGTFGRIDLGANAPDIVAPTVAITSPARTAAVAGIIPITVIAHDDVAVTQVQYFAGVNSIGTVTAAPFTFNWNSASVANGAVNLTAQAKDAAGNLTTSGIVTVTVGN